MTKYSKDVGKKALEIIHQKPISKSISVKHSNKAHNFSLAL